MTVAAPARVAERLVAGGVPLWRHPAWEERFPWLVQGTTGAGTGEEEFDLAVFGGGPLGAAFERWERVRAATGMRAAVHARQIHGAALLLHDAVPEEGLLLAAGVDGHLTTRPGLLLSVSVADCVPVFLVGERSRALALVHAGWRGVAAGIVEAAVGRLRQDLGTDPADLWLHCGPSICGECYEVGPEVHAGVEPDAEPPGEPTPIDLRAAIVRRATALGVAERRASVSAHCTRCGPGAFFSHRGGSPARQMGLLGRADP
jgi:polyphenol oxidase